MFEATRDIRFGVEVDTRGLSRGLGNAQRQVSNFSRQSTSSFGKIENSANKFIKAMIAPAAGFFAAQTVYRMIRQVTDLDAKLVRIGIDGNLTAKQTAGLKDQIFSLGMSTGVGTEKMVELSASAMDAYKDFGKVTKNLGFMTTVMQASGASAKDVGKYFGDLSDNAKMSDKDIESLTARLYSFGKSTNREMKFGEIMANVPDMVKQARMTLGKDASVKAIGDMIVTSMFTGSPGAVNKATRTMLKKGKILSGQLGFDLSKGMPSIAEVAMKIISTSKNAGDAAGKMYEMFGKSASELQKLWTEQDAFNASLKEMGNAGALYKDAADQSVTLAAGMEKFGTTMTVIADATLGPVLSEVAKGLSGISPSDIKAIAEAFTLLGTSMAYVAKGYLLIPGFYKELASIGADKRAKSEEYSKELGVTPEAADVLKNGSFLDKWLMGKVLSMGESPESKKAILGATTGTESPSPYAPSRALNPGIEQQPGYVPYTINLEAKTYLDGVSLPSKTTVTSTNDRQFTMMSGGR